MYYVFIASVLEMSQKSTIYNIDVTRCELLACVFFFFSSLVSFTGKYTTFSNVSFNEFEISQNTLIKQLFYVIKNYFMTRAHTKLKEKREKIK